MYFSHEEEEEGAESHDRLLSHKQESDQPTHEKALGLILDATGSQDVAHAKCGESGVIRNLRRVVIDAVSLGPPLVDLRSQWLGSWVSHKSQYSVSATT